MKALKNLMKLVAAGAAIAGIAYVIIKHIDTISNWLKGLCPCCKCDAVAEDDFVEEAASQETVEEVPFEEIPADEIVEEASVDETVPVAEGEPLADESDFED